MSTLRLFGTDGIRGEVAKSEDDNLSSLNTLCDKRLITPMVMAIVGYSCGSILKKTNLIEEPRNTESYVPRVVIGWDRRPSNSALVNGLSFGLKKAGCKICWAGEVPTPGLQYCVLSSDFDAGFMITASHNPYTDSGVKLFDSHGYKSMPPIEDIISELAWNIAKENKITLDENIIVNPDELIDGIDLYKSALTNRLEDIEETNGGKIEQYYRNNTQKNIFYLDSSGGSATDWLADILGQLGLNVCEVSNRETPLNQSCGAGDFSPTSSWKWRELLNEKTEHSLLVRIRKDVAMNGGISPWSPGQLIGAALDGDGDRCLLFEATNDGMKIVNGDQITDEILRSIYFTSSERNWDVACTIEADMGLTASMARFSPKIAVIETAVGDRWLSTALRAKTEGRFLWGKKQPACMGCEDSGHIVLPIKHPHLDNYWSLVGDGIVTLLSVLSARIVINNNEDISPTYEKGWKKRVSVKDTDRKKWDGKNELAEKVFSLVENNLGHNIANLKKENIHGENNLLMIKGVLNNCPISVGIRNSGTEAKTSISIRAAPNMAETDLLKLDVLIQDIYNILESSLCT